MNQDCSHRTLARFFERQRAADQSAAPPFARLCPATQPRERGRRHPAITPALVLAVVPALALSLLRFHARDAGAIAPALARGPAIAVTAWPSPTDALLQNYAEIPLASISPLGGSWTDGLLPSRPISATQETPALPSKS